MYTDNNNVNEHFQPNLTLVTMFEPAAFFPPKLHTAPKRVTKCVLLKNQIVHLVNFRLLEIARKLDIVMFMKVRVLIMA